MDVLVCLFGILLVFIGHGDAVIINNCEQCALRLTLMPGGGDTCMDPYPGGYSGMWGGCNTGDTHCLKIKTITYLYDSGSILGKPRETVTLTRTCIKRPGETDKCKRWETDGGFMIWCICSNADNCNGGNAQRSNIVLVTLTLAGVAFLRTVL